jgi:hypothetical protein
MPMDRLEERRDNAAKVLNQLEVNFLIDKSMSRAFRVFAVHCSFPEAHALQV